jgi:hypothetical protein
MKLRNKWNVYHKLNFSYPLSLSLSLALRSFKARNLFSPFGSEGNYEGLDHQQVYKKF